MKTQARHDLSEFHRYIGDKINRGETSLSPEQVLDEWRTLQPDCDAAESDLAAIQEALDDMAKGDLGIPFEEFDRAFRMRNALPSKS
jgi:hypothetical protein